jgi:hypothetical protein
VVFLSSSSWMSGWYLNLATTISLQILSNSSFSVDVSKWRLLILSWVQSYWYAQHHDAWSINAPVYFPLPMSCRVSTYSDQTSLRTVSYWHLLGSEYTMHSLFFSLSRGLSTKIGISNMMLLWEERNLLLQCFQAI